MICENIKPKLRDYFEDLVPENDRMPIRSHLSECSSCRDYTFAFGNFTSDLRRLASLEPPAGLREQIFRELEKPAHHSAAKNKWGFLWAWVAAAGLILLGLGLGHQLRHFQNRPAEESLLPEPEPEAPEEMVFQLPKSADPLHSSKYDIVLRPFHWDVEFGDLEKRSAFLEELRKRYGTITGHFEAPFFVAFSAQRADLKEVLNLLMSLGAGIRGAKVLPSYIPEYSGKVRISLSLGVPQSHISRTLLHHWHLKFDLPNKFTFKERLRDSGVRFLYEVPEAWVLEIRGQNFDQIQSIIKDTQGLAADIGQDRFLSTESYKNIPVRISLYIDEG